MKHKLVLFAALFLIGTHVQAQKKKDKTTSSSSSSSGAKCFDEGSHILNVGIGFGGGRYYSYGGLAGYSYRVSPAFSLSYEQALKKKVGPGYLGLGAYFGYQTAHLQYDNYYYNGNKYYYRHSWNYMLISARGAYHLDLLNAEKGELYFGAIIGIRFQTYKYESNSIDPNKKFYQLNSSSVYPSYSAFIGGRYYFAPKVAAFAEIGYGISYLTAGISFKF